MIDGNLEQLFIEWKGRTGDAQAAATLAAAQWQGAANVVADDAPLKPADVAKLLRVSVNTVLEWIDTNQMKASNLATGSRPRYVIQRADLDRFLQSRQPDPPSRRRRAG